MAELGNDSGGGMTFVTVFDGKLIQRVPEGTDGATSRQLTKGANEGKTVWEKTHTSATGMLTGGGVEVKDFGGKKVKEIHAVLDNEIMVQLPMTLLAPLGQVVNSIDTTKPVKISVYKNKRGKTGMNVSQDGKQLDWEHTKDSPNGMPEAVYDEELEEWDFKARDSFLIKKVKAFFERFEKSMPEAQEAPDANSPAENDELEEIDMDDIPF